MVGAAGQRMRLVGVLLLLTAKVAMRICRYGFLAVVALVVVWSIRGSGLFG